MNVSTLINPKISLMPDALTFVPCGTHFFIVATCNHLSNSTHDANRLTSLISVPVNYP